jgi:hypothetical protein
MTTMKSLKFLFLAVLVLLASCELEPSHVVYSNALTYLTSSNVPTTGIAGQSLNISATGKAYNDCWSNITISLGKSTTYRYNLMATGYYESYGTCESVEVVADTIIAFKPETAGTYIITKFLTPYSTDNDTIIVTAE